MILRKAIFNNAQPEQTGGQNEVLTVSSPDGWRRGLERNPETQAMKISAANRCVQVISDSMGKLPIKVFNEETKKPSDKHNLHHMLTLRTNEDMTPSDYKKYMEKEVLLNGNAYALIIRNKRTAEPFELIPLRDCWAIRDGGKLWYVGKNPRTGEYRKFSPADIIHYKYFSDDGITGMSVLSHAQKTLDNVSVAQEYEQKYYSQRARPDGVLSVESLLEPETKRRMRDEWDKFHSGADNAFRTAILDSGIKYQPIAISPKDSQFIENKGITTIDIARFFGVPPYKIYEGDQSYSSNEQHSIEYVVNTLHPRVQRYDEEDTYKLLFDGDIRQNLRIKRNMMAELKGDYESRAKWYETMHRISAFSPNDIRDLEDLPTVEGGDIYFASWNYGPLDQFRELSEKRAQRGKAVE